MMILKLLRHNMGTEGSMAKQLLNAVWNEDVKKARALIQKGADPNWIFNGYPLLIHAVFTRNQEMVMMLIEEGASQVSEALGFALDRGVGEMVFPLAFLGIVPKIEEPKGNFGPYPARFAPLEMNPLFVEGS
jgi:hypothetical protein